MALLSNYIDSFSDLQDKNSAGYQLTTFVAKGFASQLSFMIDLYRPTNDEYRSQLLVQTGYGNPGDDQITQLVGWVKTNAAAVSASTEDEKWNEFKASFPSGLQPAIEVIINYERGLSIPFDTFKAISTTDMALLILSLTTSPNDFWTPFVTYYKDKINQQEDGWLVYEKDLSGEYQYAIALLDALAQGQVINGIDLNLNWGDINQLKQQSAQYLAKNAVSVNYGGFIQNYAWFLANLIRNNAEATIDSFISPDQYEANFYSRFRVEYNAGIQAFIQSLKDQGIITEFSDLLDIPASSSTTGSTTQVADPSHPQIDNIVISFTGKGDNSLGSTFFYEVSIGDIFVLDLNGNGTVSYTATAASKANVYAGLANAINTATGGDWALVTASDQTTYLRITANSNNIPFVIKHVSLYSELNRFAVGGPNTDQLYLPATHPIYLSIAEGWLNDANSINTSTTITRNFNGQAFKLEGLNTPASNIVLTIYDISGVDPVEIGTTLTDNGGYFTLNYTSSNIFITSQTVRLQAKDIEGNIIKIITDQEHNLFTDAAGGTFEGGTPPSYSEWNLVLGTDIKIGDNETIGAEVAPNYDFSQASGGWHSAYPPNSGNLITGLTGYFGFSIGVPKIYTEDILVVGQKYKISVNVTGAGAMASVTLKDTSDATLYDFGSVLPGLYETTFEATSTAVYLDGVACNINLFSLKEIEQETAFEGFNSPQFYLDATTPSSTDIFYGNTAIPVQANTWYDLTLYVRFLSPIVKPFSLPKSGILLRPRGFTLSELSEYDLTNGSQISHYKDGALQSVSEILPDQWYPISTRFNTGVSTSIKVETAITDDNYSDYIPNFGIFVDQFKLQLAAADYKDITIDINATSLTNVYAVVPEESSLTTAISQTASVSQPQITNIFPGQVSTGDLYILDLNHEGSVSYRAATDVTADTVAGLVAAITADTSDVTISTPTPAGPSTAQISHLTIEDIHIGAEFTFQLNGKSSISFTAASTTMADITAGITEAITVQTADLNISVTQNASLSLPQITRLTPTDVLVGAKFIVRINDNDTVQYTAAAATVADVVTGLVSAINSGNGDWTQVNATSGGGDAYVVITANSNNNPFDVLQSGEGWKEIIPTDDAINNRVIITSKQNNVTFTVTQVGGAWKIVTAQDHTSYLTVTGDSNNVPFSIYTQVVPASESTILLSTALDSLNIDPTVEVQESLLLKGIYTLSGVLSLGGLGNNLDGIITIKLTTKATSSLPQTTQINFNKVNIGDIIQLSINGSDTITYLALSDIYSEITTALVTLITAASGGWDTVSVTSGGDCLILTANSNNTPFTITQVKIADDPSVKQIDTAASLFTLTNNEDFTEEQIIAVISNLMDAGYSSVLTVPNVDQKEFVSVVREVVGDFNAAKMYQEASLTRNLTQDLINQYLPATGTYSITKAGMSDRTATLMSSIIKERCACDDCYTAVSPLAYLTDLINYVVKNLNKIDSTKITIDDLTSTFYQNFVELPSDCDAVTAKVCQTRIAIEVLRRYVSAHTITNEETLKEYQEAIRDYTFSLYEYLLVAVGTSYEEISMISSEEDKRALAARLKIDYDSNPDYLNKLFIAPNLLFMEDWADYLLVINGEIQQLIDYMSIALDGLGTQFEVFKALSPVDLKTQLISIPDSDNFHIELATIIRSQASSIQSQTSRIYLPFNLREELRWSRLQLQLTTSFSVSFQKSFEIFIQGWRRKSSGNNFVSLVNATIDDLVDFILTLDGRVNTLSNYDPEDFWLPFAAALKSKVEAFSLSERDLEEIFGWPDTSRDPYSTGAKLGDDENIVSRWTINGAQWGVNTDAQGYVYLLMNESDGIIEIFKDDAWTKKVATAFFDSETGKYLINEYEDSGLSGEFIVTELDETTEISISIIPLLLSWQQTALRVKWKAEDAATDIPVIDPDLITLADIKYPYNINTSSPSKPADFWMKRNEELDTYYEELKYTREHNNTTVDNEATIANIPAIGLSENSEIAVMCNVGSTSIQKLVAGNFDEIVSDITSLGITTYGNTYFIVTEATTSEVRQYNYNGDLVWSFGVNGFGSIGTFDLPRALTIGKKKDLYISDAGSDTNEGRIQRFTINDTVNNFSPTARLTVTTIVPPAPDVIQVVHVTPDRVSPGARFRLGVYGTGTVTYVATSDSVEEVVNGLLYEFSLLVSDYAIFENKGTYLKISGNIHVDPFVFAVDQFTFPTFYNIAVNSVGNRFIPDSDNNIILQVTQEGKEVSSYGNAHRLTKELQLFFRFNDEDSGSNVRDTSLNGFNGTITGDPNWISNGKTGGALVLDGSTNFVQVPTHSSVDGSNQTKRSVELWFNATNKDNTDYQVLYRQGDDVQGLNIYIKSGILYVGSYGTSPSTWSNFLYTNRVLSGTWQHIVVVFDNIPYPGKNKFRAYLDGIEFTISGQGNSGEAIEASTSSNGITIGALYNGKIKFNDDIISSPVTDYYFDGQVDNFRIWNRALNGYEISFLYGRMEDQQGTLFMPGALKVNAKGEVYVADNGNSRVVKFTAAGNFALTFGEYGNEEGQFKFISGIGLDEINGYVYASDNINNTVQQFTDIEFINSFISPTPGFSSPGALAVGQGGILYVVDKGHNQIKLFDVNGNQFDLYSTYDFAGTPTSFNSPIGLAVDSQNRLIVLNNGDDRLVLMERKDSTVYVLAGGPWQFYDSLDVGVDAEGYVHVANEFTKISRTRFPEQFSSIRVPDGMELANTTLGVAFGLAIDLFGNLWISDTSFDRVLKLTPDGTLIKAIDSVGSGDGQLNNPRQLAIDESGNVYVTDSGNNRIQKFDNNGVFLAKWISADAPSGFNVPYGIAVDSQRKIWVTQTSNTHIPVFNGLQGLDSVLNDVFNITASEFLELSVNEKSGVDISDSLDNMKLSYAAYRQIMKLITLLEKRSTINSDQWNDFYNVFVQQYKNVQYALWKTEEADADIILSQDLFDQFTAERVFSDWRSTEDAFLKWQKILQTRIDESQVLVVSKDNIITTAEDEQLIPMRNILIAYSDFPGNTLLEKASYGTDKLLLDLKNDCCQHTTRVSQAIETLQNLMWGIRNGLLSEQYSSYSISVPETFDNEWVWMGSYASWRSAQFVFMYPENLLLPTYSDRQSDGFKRLVDTIRMNPQVNSDSINEYVGEFYDYIDDVRQMTMVTATEAAALSNKQSRGIRENNEEYKNFIFIIGKGGKTNKYYYSTIDAGDPDLKVDSSWILINGIDETKVSGVIDIKSVRMPDNKRYLILFMQIDDSGSSKIGYLKYDLQSNTWNENITEVDIPEFGSTSSESNSPLRGIVIDHTNVLENTSYYSGKNIFEDTLSSDLIIAINRGTVKAYRFNNTLTSLKDVESDDTQVELPYANMDNVYAMSDRLVFSGSKKFYQWGSNNTPTLNVVSYANVISWPEKSVKLSLKWRVLFWQEKDIINTLKYRTYFSNAAENYQEGDITIPNLNKNALKYLTVFMTSKDNFYILYQNGTKIKTQEISINIRGEITTNTNNTTLITFPDVAITYPDPSGDLAFRSVATDLYTNKEIKSDPWNYRYVDEIYYAIPMLAALVLQQRGDYQAALQWYKLIYNYSAKNKADAPVYGLLANSSMINIIDDFETNRNYAYEADPSIDYKGVSNPDKAGNSSEYCGNWILKPSGWSGNVFYDVSKGNSINLNDPAFSIDVMEANFSSPTKVGIEIYGTIGGVQTYHSVYSAYTYKSGWQKLTFNRDGINPGSVNSITSIRLTIINSQSSLDAKQFYIDNFKAGNQSVYNRPVDWLSDPLNPHAIASQRPDSYLRYTILSLASCMIAYANNEFTQDTIESVPRARILYERALELLNEYGLGGIQERCRNEVTAFDIEVTDDWRPVWEQIKEDLYKVETPTALDALLADIDTVIEGSETEEQKMQTIRDMVNLAIASPELFARISTNILQGEMTYENAYLSLLSDNDIVNHIKVLTKAIGGSYKQSIQSITGVKDSVLLSDKVYPEGTAMSKLYSTNTILNTNIIKTEQITGDLNDLEAIYRTDNNYNPASPGDTGAQRQQQLMDLNLAVARLYDYKVKYMPSMNPVFCIPSNPIIDNLRLVSEVNLYKIRTCRNIAGQVRELSPFAAQTDSISGIPQLNSGAPVQLPSVVTYLPSIYRYSFLIERAKQLVQLAQQVEASMLSTLEKLDAERYSILKARQDVNLSQAGVRLQELRIKEANDNVGLAQLQKDKSQIIYDTYSDWINEGLLASETKALKLLENAATLYTLGAIASIGNPVEFIKDGGNIFLALTGFAQSAATASSIAAMSASFERRTQEWQLQKDIATKDIKIGNQQITLAKDQLAIVGQERNIAQLQVDNANSTVDFLVNKFTNAELYDWMSDVLQGVYSFFLQQATASAQLASNQLAFERQQTIPKYIKADYWQSPVDTLLLSGPGQNKNVDRKGLTGAESLLQDIYELEQYSLSTDIRKLELTKTISLAAFDPSAFQRFKETGELNFDITLSLFDRDFPGHYLRLIKSVKTSLIALVSPIDGIKATLTNSGVSRVVVQGADFQKIQMQRPSETVALTSPSSASGLFEMSQVQNEKLLPFENTGVETQWIFRLPKAANLFDYNSIADVLLTIEYTALNSNVYRNKVIKELSLNGYAAERVFSFRNNFADQWYDLNNSQLTATPMQVSFKTTKADFPTNIKDLNSTGLIMYFVKSENLDPSNANDAQAIDQINTLKVTALNFTPDNAEAINTSDTKAVNGMISTSSTSGESWVSICKKGVSGTWRLSFDQSVAPLFTNGHIVDILFLVSVDGKTGSW